MGTEHGPSGVPAGAPGGLRQEALRGDTGHADGDARTEQDRTVRGSNHAIREGVVVLERTVSVPGEAIEVVEQVAIPELPPGRRTYLVAKRVFDLLASASLIVLTLPVMVVLWVLVRLDSRGPAIFRQDRVGKDGEIFRFYKFRTMYVDARERFPDLYAYDYSPEDVESMFFKLPHDPRLTRLGRRLRRTSLDELPNLFCVLLGRMTMVGPRPEIPEMVAYYRPGQLAKFSVKPGLTGLAQVSGRNILRFQETISADLLYVERRGFWYDLGILVRTVKAVILMMGAH